jgi:hypothetical protein
MKRLDIRHRIHWCKYRDRQHCLRDITVVASGQITTAIDTCKNCLNSYQAGEITPNKITRQHDVKDFESDLKTLRELGRL